MGQIYIIITSSSPFTHTSFNTRGGEVDQRANVCDIIGLRCVTGPCRTLKQKCRRRVCRITKRTHTFILEHLFLRCVRGQCAEYKVTSSFPWQTLPSVFLCFISSPARRGSILFSLQASSYSIPLFEPLDSWNCIITDLMRFYQTCLEAFTSELVFVWGEFSCHLTHSQPFTVCRRARVLKLSHAHVIVVFLFFSICTYLTNVSMISPDQITVTLRAITAGKVSTCGIFLNTLWMDVE